MFYSTDRGGADRQDVVRERNPTVKKFMAPQDKLGHLWRVAAVVVLVLVDVLELLIMSQSLQLSS